MDPQIKLLQHTIFRLVFPKMGNQINTISTRNQWVGDSENEGSWGVRGWTELAVWLTKTWNYEGKDKSRVISSLKILYSTHIQLSVKMGVFRI